MTHQIYGIQTGLRWEELVDMIHHLMNIIRNKLCEQALWPSYTLTIQEKDKD